MEEDNNVNEPKLRFPGFTGAWEQCKLLTNIKNIIDFRGRTPKKLGMDWSDSGYLALSALNVKNGFIDPTADAHYGDEKLYQKWMNGRELQKGQVLFTTEAPMGNVAQVPDNRGYILSQRTIAFDVNQEKITNDFLATLLRTPKVFDNLYALSSGGTAKGVSQRSLSELNVIVPLSILEQVKIGQLFKQLDNLITLHQRKLNNLKNKKKGLLQKMFPKEGEKYPEIRFSGFTDAWEQRKLSSMTQYKNGKGHEDKQSESGKLELINLNSISIDGGLKHSGKFINEIEDTLQKNDIVMILSDVGHGDLLGRVALIPEDNRFVLNQRVALLRPNETADPKFLFSFINAHQYYFKSLGAGMSQLNISKGSVENFNEYVPSLNEQAVIGKFLQQLDNLITLHQRKLDHLKERKKSLLEQMFI